MFDSLTDRLGDVFDRLRKRGALSEADVTAALREVRAGLAELKKAFPSPMPPRTPIKDHAAVLADVGRIELAAGKLM